MYERFNNWFCSVWLWFQSFLLYYSLDFFPSHFDIGAGYWVSQSTLIHVNNAKYLWISSFLCIDDTIFRMSYIFFRDFKYFLYIYLILFCSPCVCVCVCRPKMDCILLFLCSYVIWTWIKNRMWFKFDSLLFTSLILKKKAILSIESWRYQSHFYGSYFSFVSFLFFSLHKTWNTQNHHDCIL